MKPKILLTFISAIVAPLAVAALTRACAVCVTGANDPTADAYNWSVLFLMATPYLVVGSIAGSLVYMYRRAVAKREQAEAERSLVHLAWNHKESGR
jgi:hypothetical protein